MMSAAFIVEFLERVKTDYKNPNFSEELEYRIQINQQKVGSELNENLEKVKYRSNGKLIIPYIELETRYNFYNKSSGEIVGTTLQEKLPIEEIIIGPSLNYVAVKEGLLDLLNACGYPRVKISRSKIPYRI